MPSILSNNGSFTEWVERQLKNNGWNREYLAQRMDVYPSVISKIMNGEVGIGPNVARKMAKAFSVSQYEVFRAAGLIDEGLYDDDIVSNEYQRLLNSIEDENERQDAITLVAVILRHLGDRIRRRRG